MSSLYKDVLEGTHYGKDIPKIVIDTEVESCKGGDPSPHLKHAKLLSVGFKYLYRPFTKTYTSYQIFEPHAVIGHSVKFDINHLRRAGYDTDYIVMAYDTQQMYHILTGKTWASLDEVAEWCGVECKKSTLKDYYNEGYSTSQIPQTELEDYLIQDVSVTEQCFIYMWEQMDSKQRTLMHIMARTTMMLAEMEYNGLEVDRVKLREKVKALNEEEKVLNSIIDKARHEVTQSMGTDRYQAWLDNWNPTSPAGINQMVFGKPLKYKVKEEVGTYKNGNPKYQNVEHQCGVPTNIYSFVKDLEETKNGLYPTDEKSLKEYLLSGELDEEREHYVVALLRLKKINKLKSTYYGPIGEMIQVTHDGRVHGQLNQAATSTGRLSSSKPNMQNMSEDVEEIFVNRYNPAYGICKPDFSQLEVMGAAILSWDTTLIQDIKDGIDIHQEIANQIGGKIDRRTVKGVVFGTIYGGGAKGLSKQSGVPEATVRKIQKAFFQRYYILEGYRNKYASQVNSLSPCSSKYVGGTQINTTKANSLTGRSYFYTYYSGNGPSWTQLCNYPVQGLATADIVPAVLALLHTYQRYYDDTDILKEFKFTNTVHDSIYGEGNFPANSESNYNVRLVFDTIVNDVFPVMFNEWTGEELPVDLKLDFDIKLPKEVDDAS